MRDAAAADGIGRAGAALCLIADPHTVVMVVLGTTIHEFACDNEILPIETRGWSD